MEIDGKRVKLQIWDTAGQERFRTITTAYYRGAMGILLVYDVSDEKSFENVRGWMRNIEQHASSSVNKILIGEDAFMTIAGDIKTRLTRLNRLTGSKGAISAGGINLGTKAPSEKSKCCS